MQNRPKGLNPKTKKKLQIIPHQLLRDLRIQGLHHMLVHVPGKGQILLRLHPGKKGKHQIRAQPPRSGRDRGL